jgi:hypothetical protein
MVLMALVDADYCFTVIDIGNYGSNIVMEEFFQIHYWVKGWQRTNLICLFLLICLGLPY